MSGGIKQEILEIEMERENKQENFSSFVTV